LLRNFFYNGAAGRAMSVAGRLQAGGERPQPCTFGCSTCGEPSGGGLGGGISIIYQQSWLTGEVSDDWRIAGVTCIYEKGQKEDLGATDLSA